MRLRKVKDADVIINKSKYIINNPNLMINSWANEFGNSNPIHIEIGMGKGEFISNMAIKYPNINFIGIEKFDSVMIRATQKINNYNLDNLRLICCDAIDLNKIFNKEIDLIYLNFSDPWPKKRHAKRRLTSKMFLDIYESVFKEKKIIYMKTDNIGLFGYSIESLSQNGYVFENVSLNYNDTNNVLTEYESKFREKGIKINRFEAFK